MKDKVFIAWLAKQAAEAAFRSTTSSAQTVPVASADGRSRALAVMMRDPPTNAQGHTPTRYGRKIKR